MTTKAPRTVFVCTECGAKSPKWMGKCPHCGRWNTMAEEVIQPEPEVSANSARRTSLAGLSGESRATAFRELSLPTYMRSGTGLGELDRVLGGGLVLGSVVLLANRASENLRC